MSAPIVLILLRFSTHVHMIIMGWRLASKTSCSDSLMISSLTGFQLDVPQVRCPTCTCSVADNTLSVGACGGCEKGGEQQVSLAIAIVPKRRKNPLGWPISWRVPRA